MRTDCWIIILIGARHTLFLLSWPSGATLNKENRLTWLSFGNNFVRNNKNKCWAKYFGDCEGELTAEHLISKSLFPDGKLYVEGFPWCQSGKKVGINSLTRKILCKKHNNEFSVVDSEAKYAINCFEKGKTERPINGLLFERWLLKTAINLSIDSDFHLGVGFSESIKGYPSPYAIALALNMQPFDYKMGMYLLENKIDIPNNPVEHLMMPITKNDEIGMFLFSLRGVHILLNLTPTFQPSKLSSIGIYDSLPIETGNKLFYRPIKLTNTNIETGIINCVEFSYS